MRLAHIVPSLEERHGGPSRSVRALANAMASAGADAELLTTLQPGEPMAMSNDAAMLSIFPRGRPRWLCPSRGMQRRLKGEHYDCVHHHSLWLLTLHYAAQAARRQRAPLVIAPRGMMSQWAWRHRRWRKFIAEVLVHPGAFRDAAGWHATSEEEATDIRRLGFRQPICVAPNGVTIPTPGELASARAHWESAMPQIPGRRVALFYSRFHRKKRLRELIEIWSRSLRRDWFLLIAGVPEEYSAAEVASWLDAAGLQSSAAVIDGRGHPPPYAAADLFLLPSHSENFGLVIAEALAAGVPAIVTDSTPWRGLDTNHAGWCTPWTDFAATMEDALAADPAVLQQRGAKGRAWVEREFTWARAAEQLLKFYPTLRRG